MKEQERIKQNEVSNGAITVAETSAGNVVIRQGRSFVYLEVLNIDALISALNKFHSQKQTQG